MNDPQTQDNTTFTSETTEQTRKVWVAPNLEIIPLNEAEASHAAHTHDGVYAMS